MPQGKIGAAGGGAGAERGRDSGGDSEPPEILLPRISISYFQKELSGGRLGGDNGSGREGYTGSRLP